MIALHLTTLAWSAPPEPEPLDPAFRLVVRGVIERWNDPSLAAVYQSGTWLGGVGGVIPVFGPLSLDLEASFRRLTSEGSTLEVAPLSGLVLYEFKSERVHPFVGAGSAWTVFSETVDGREESIVGARIQGEARAGIWVDTQLVQRPLPPAVGGPIQAVELELYAARRFGVPFDGEPIGLLFGAWRASIGLGLVF